MTIDGKPVTAPTALRNDADENGPTVVQMGTVRFQVIKRGERYGLRVKDASAQTRTHFQGLDYYPIDPKWRVEARLRAVQPAEEDPDHRRDRHDVRQHLAGRAGVHGRRQGVPHRSGARGRVATSSSSSSRTRRAATTTYPAGRYLYAPKPGPDGKSDRRFQQGLQPALRVHAVRDLPAAAAAEPATDPDRGRGEAVRRAATPKR